MDMNRRTFLIQSGSAIGVLGLGYLLVEPPEGPTPSPGDAKPPSHRKPPTALLKAALERMAREQKPGIAIRIPKNPDRRHTAGHTLLYYLNQMDSGSLRLFAQTVVICLESAAFDDEFAGANPKHEIILFDASRRAESGIAFDFEQGWQGFVPALLALVQGDGDRRLSARAASIREKSPAELMEALDRLSTEAERAQVAAQASRMAPLLVYEELQPTQEFRRKALGEILRQYVESASPTDPGPRLPFGIQAGAARGGCGDSCQERPEPHMVAACGMARVRPSDRDFVRYLAQ
jgi:hypothetical protein